MVKQQQKHMVLTQMVKRRRSPDKDPQKGYDRKAHEGCLIRSTCNPRGVINIHRTVSDDNENVIKQLQTILNKQSITKDDKAIALTITKELEKS